MKSGGQEARRAGGRHCTAGYVGFDAWQTRRFSQKRLARFLGALDMDVPSGWSRPTGKRATVTVELVRRYRRDWRK
jgi:hypothetical protein